MKIVLELLDQSSSVRKITVRHDIVIGRGSECNLRLSAPQVSRRHCFLRIGRDGISVTDLDSSNGTWINGQRIPAGVRRELTDGTQLSLGPVRFLLHVRPETISADLVGPGNLNELINTPNNDLTTVAHQASVPATAFIPHGRAAANSAIASLPAESEADDSRAEIIELGRQLNAHTNLPSAAVIRPELDPDSQRTERPDNTTTAHDIDLGPLSALENVDVLDPNVLQGKFPPERPMWHAHQNPLGSDSVPPTLRLNPNHAALAPAHPESPELEYHPEADPLHNPDAEADSRKNNGQPADEDFGPELSAFLKGL
jgi:predicted component of type VI protein secretion system